ncbi:hypothetical protein NQ315_009417, partial [Exocentrus adspersus]
DRHKRDLSKELPQGDMVPKRTPPVIDPCLPFVNVKNYQFQSPTENPDDPTSNYSSNIDCVLVLEGLLPSILCLNKLTKSLHGSSLRRAFTVTAVIKPCLKKLFVFLVTAPPQHLIKLDFRDYFEIEESPKCKNDFLEIMDGPHGYNDRLGPPFCGMKKFPPLITSSDRHLWIHFKSDDSIEGRGFKAVFEFIPRPNSSTIPEKLPCYINRIHPYEGFLERGDIPKEIIDFNSENDMPIDCLWAITVQENWKIYLQFDKFSLEKPNDCESNFVQVFSNKTDLASQDKQFCGSIADTVLSKSNKMFVRFYSKSKGEKTLFMANYTAYREMGSDKEIKCKLDEEFYCEDATCIHISLKCNKRFNCRSRFDEDGCQGSSEVPWSGDHMIIIMVIFSLILIGMCITFIYNCITKLMRDHQTIQVKATVFFLDTFSRLFFFKKVFSSKLFQEYMRQSEQQLNELDKHRHDKKSSSKVGSQSRSHSSPSMDSNRFDAANAVNTPCYVPGGDILPILVRSEHSLSPSNGDAYNTNIYTVDNDNPPEMCDSACQTRESLFTTQGYSSGNSTPNHSVHTNSPPAPFSTFGYQKDNKFKAEAKIEMVSQTRLPNKYEDKRRPYSVQTTKSAPDVIVTH